LGEVLYHADKWSFFIVIKAVTSTYEPLRRRVESVVDLALQIVTPLSARSTGQTAWTKGRSGRKRLELEGDTNLKEEAVEDKDTEA
jgi:hypothetical protein